MSCTDEPAGVWPDQEPTANKEVGVDFTAAITRWRAPRTDYAQGVRFRVRSVAGFEYEVTTAGQTGEREPIYPKTAAATVTDGSAILTCRAATTASLSTTVASVAWVPDAALTLSDQSDVGQASVAKLTGGEDGVDYAVLVTATCADGQVIPKRCILPVRIPTRTCAC